MRIAIDTREQLPYSFGQYDCEVVTASLSTGDYSLECFEDKISIERKALDDIIGCMTTGRERFEKELARARSLERFAVIIEASFEEIAHGQYRSQMTPKSAVQTLVAWQIRYGTTFIFAGSRRAGEYLTFSILEKYLAEIEKRFKALVKAGKKDAVTRRAAAG